MVIKIGKGEDKSHGYFPIGQLSASLGKATPKNFNIKKFGEQLAKQLGIKDGVIELHSIEFTYNSKEKVK